MKTGCVVCYCGIEVLDAGIKECEGIEDFLGSRDGYGGAGSEGCCLVRRTDWIWDWVEIFKGAPFAEDSWGALIRFLGSIAQPPIGGGFSADLAGTTSRTLRLLFSGVDAEADLAFSRIISMKGVRGLLMGSKRWSATAIRKSSRCATTFSTVMFRISNGTHDAKFWRVRKNKKDGSFLNFWSAIASSRVTFAGSGSASSLLKKSGAFLSLSEKSRS